MSFADNIKNSRLKTYMTQEDFAKELGVSFATVNRWETGKTFPNLSTMKKIKVFCDGHNVEYEKIEKEWLSQCLGNNNG